MRGEDRIFIRDWNLTPSEEPVFSAVLSGGLHLGDDLLGPSGEGIATRKGGRHIDYCLHSVGFLSFRRQQSRGVAGHDLVFLRLSGGQDGRYFP